MHTHHLLPLALLAGPAFARPSPPNTQYISSPIHGIAQTFTDRTNSTANSTNTTRCTAEYVLPNSRDCGAVALANGVQLGTSESYYPSASSKCKTILRGYGICPVDHPNTETPPAFFTPTPSSAGLNNTASPTAFSIPPPVNAGSNNTGSWNGTVNAPSNGTINAPSNGTINAPSNGTLANNATLGNGTLNFSRFDASVLATKVLTSYELKTLSYTMGTSGAADARTIVVTRTLSNTVTFTTMAKVVGISTRTKAKASPSPTLVPARVVLQVLPEGTSTLTTEYREHGTYTALTTVASDSGARRFNNVKRETTTCLGSMAIEIAPSPAPVKEKRQVPTCANAVSAPAPTATGTVSGCSAWHVVVPGEDCASIPAIYGITSATFKTWNPSLDASCYNLLTGIAYCVSRCGLISEPSSLDALPAVANTTAALLPATKAVLPTSKSMNDGMWTPDAVFKTSSTVAALQVPTALSKNSTMPMKPEPKTWSPVVPVSSLSGMLKVPKPTQSAVAQAPEAMPTGMGGFGSFPFASVIWNGFGAGQSSAAPTIAASSLAIPSVAASSLVMSSVAALSVPTATLASPTLAAPSMAKAALPSASALSLKKPVPFSAPVSMESSPELDVPSETSSKLEIPTVPSKKLEVSKNYTSSPVEYKTYSGDGSVAAGWPSMEDWLDFETLFEMNKPDMLSGCATWGLPNDSEDEIASIKSAIKSVAAKADDIDERFILAIIMQESKGCVRVVTTSWAHNNPGLMQTHQGTGSCNTPTVQTPCPDSEILQMVEDGTLGTAVGDGLQQCKQKQAAGQPDEASAWYRTARQYNGGSIAASGNLEEGCCTLTYASDVANRLVGWVHPPSTSA